MEGRLHALQVVLQSGFVGGDDARSTQTTCGRENDLIVAGRPFGRVNARLARRPC